MKEGCFMENLNEKELSEINGGYKYIQGMRFTDDGKPAPTWDYVQGQLGNAFVTSLNPAKYQHRAKVKPNNKKFSPKLQYIYLQETFYILAFALFNRNYIPIL